MATATKTWKMYIGGGWVDSGRGEAEPNIDPSTERIADEVQVGSRDDADRAVGAAQKAYDEVWFDTPPKERSAMLFKLADAIDADAENLALLEAQDVGKPISVSSADIPFISDNLRFFAGAARHLEGKSAGEYEKGFTSIIRREPLGVTVGICPWNYPLMMAIWKIGPALAAGNTSIIKPAELTPRTTAAPGRALAGHPPARRVQRGHRPWFGDRRPAREAPARTPRLGHGRYRNGQDHRVERRLVQREARAPRARREGAGHRLRRRQPREPDRDAEVRRLHEHRPGLHGVLPRRCRPRHLRGPPVRARAGRRVDQDRRPRRRGGRRWGRSSRAASARA